MPSLVFPNCLEYRFHWTMNGVDAFNVLHARVAGGFANSQAFANALDTAIKGRFTTSGLAALCATTTSLVSVNTRLLSIPNQVEFVGAGAAQPGTGAGNPLPNEVAACITLRTALAGKSFRGRVYLGGFIVGENTAAGQIVAGLNTALVTFMTNVQTDMGASASTLAILSRPRPAGPGGVPAAYAGALTDVSSITTRDTLWDSQRRRKR